MSMHACTRARTNYILEPRTTNRLFFFLDLAQFMKMSIDNDNLCVSCLPIKSPSASVVGLIVRRQCHLVDVTPLPNSALEFRKGEREIQISSPSLSRRAAPHAVFFARDSDRVHRKTSVSKSAESFKCSVLIGNKATLPFVTGKCGLLSDLALYPIYNDHRFHPRLTVLQG